MFYWWIQAPFVYLNALVWAILSNQWSSFSLWNRLQQIFIFRAFGWNHYYASILSHSLFKKAPKNLIQTLISLRHASRYWWINTIKMKCVCGVIFIFKHVSVWELQVYPWQSDSKIQEESALHPTLVSFNNATWFPTAAISSLLQVPSKKLSKNNQPTQQSSWRLGSTAIESAQKSNGSYLCPDRRILWTV